MKCKLVVTRSWRVLKWQLRLTVALALVGAILEVGKPAVAQITPDKTLGAESSLVTPANINNLPSDRIDGGARRGANLFHSFLEFNVGAGQGAYFANPTGILNIITRVSGSNASNIFGKLGVLGNANLFLINPNGIVFGPNASLDVGGSFVASTASSLKFADGTEFSATAPQSTPLLTVSIPVGLQFGENAGQIVVQGQAQSLSVSPGLLAPFQTEEEASQAFRDTVAVRSTILALSSSLFSRPIGLQVQPEKTLALVGGDISLESGHLTAPGGQVEIGSVTGASLVNLNPTNMGWNIGYQNVKNFGQIRILNQASINTSGLSSGNIQIKGGLVALTNGSSILTTPLGSGNSGNISIQASQLDIGSDSIVTTSGGVSGLSKTGNVFVQTGNLTIADGAAVVTGTIGQQEAGNIKIQATDSVKVSNNSLITTSSLGPAQGGDLEIDTGTLSIQDIGKIITSTAGTGNSGTLAVSATNSVNVTNNGILTASTAATGNGGNISIETGKLRIQNGGIVSSATSGSGNGGQLVVNASEGVQVSGISSSRKNPSSLDVLAINTGKAGELVVNTRDLIVQDGGVVSSAAFGSGPGGQLNVKASESVQLTGGSEGIEFSRQLPSGLISSSLGSGEAGNLTITTGQLTVGNGAQVAVSNLGLGKAGNLEVIAGSIRLDNQGRLTATTEQGDGGNITLQALNLLLLRHGSQISTTAGTARSGGNGGNITISTPFLAAFPSENSDISANAFTGNGGKVTINASGIFGIQYQKQPTQESDITASSLFGINGTVNINTPNVNPSNGLVTLPVAVVDPSTQIAQGCGTGEGITNSQFTVTGRGGLPPNPSEVLSQNAVVADTRLPTTTAALQRSATVTAAPSSELGALPAPATGAMFNDLGQVTLIAAAPNARLEIPWLSPHTCRAN